MIMTLALIVLKKSTFQKFSDLNAYGGTFDHDVKECQGQDGTII